MEGLFLCAGLGCVSIEWLRRDFVALLEKNFDFALGRFKLRAAIVGKFHAFFKQCQSLLERHVAALKLVNYLLKPLQALFKFRHGEIVSAENHGSRSTLTN